MEARGIWHLLLFCCLWGLFCGSLMLVAFLALNYFVRGALRLDAFNIIVPLATGLVIGLFGWTTRAFYLLGRRSR